MRIDTHCHFSSTSYHVHSEHILLDVDVSLSHFNLKSTPWHKIGIGLHPWYVNEAILTKLYAIPLVVWSECADFIGEIGLDFSPRFRASRRLQMNALEYQLSLASDLGKPVSLHLFKAYQTMFECLRGYRLRGAIHGFSGSIEEARRFLSLGLRLGVNALLLRHNTPRYQRLVELLPIESFVLETDFPNIPYPDGRPADSQQLWYIAQRIAQIKSLHIDEVLTITTQNAKESFNLVIDR
jgi:TatD DNase family protein